MIDRSPRERDPSSFAPWFRPLDLNESLLYRPKRKDNECENGPSPESFEDADNRIVNSPDEKSKPPDRINSLNCLGDQCIRTGIRACKNLECKKNKDALEKSAPRCQWMVFRRWAIVTMSCLRHQQKIWKLSGMMRWSDEGEIIIHLTNALRQCGRLLQSYASSPLSYSTAFTGTLEGKSNKYSVDLFEVCEVIHWIWQANSYDGSEIGWDAKFLPQYVTLPAILQAHSTLRDIAICRTWLWNFVKTSERGSVDLPAIVDMVRHLNLDRGRRHQECTEEYCRFSDDNSTLVTQLHKCKGGSCEDLQFPPRELDDAVNHNLSTAWTMESRPKTVAHGSKYLAISHVWADGTGVGLKRPGEVNICLVEFFSDIAKRLGCSGVWWDTICVPMEREARKKAMDNMHKNYKQASYTVIHDRSLIDFEWKDDGTPCLALILSPWFTRGWTALELYMSDRVIVLFKDPKNKGIPLIKDLDKEVLSTDNAYTHPAHRMASAVVRRLRNRKERPCDFNVQSLLAILQPRNTSWARDRLIIACLMAELPDFDSSDSQIRMTRKLLTKFGELPSSFILQDHAVPVDSGAWS